MRVSVKGHRTFGEHGNGWNEPHDGASQAYVDESRTMHGPWLDENVDRARERIVDLEIMTKGPQCVDHQANVASIRCATHPTWTIGEGC